METSATRVFQMPQSTKLKQSFNNAAEKKKAPICWLIMIHFELCLLLQSLQCRCAS